MFQKLVSHNPDLQRLLEKGYAVGIDSNCLIVRDVPYLDENLELQKGVLVAKLKFITNDVFEQDNHQVYFSGSLPYGLNGNPVPNLGGNAHSFPLSEACADVVVRWSFSNKPTKAGRYKDHFHKIETYVGFISGPAESKFGISPLTFGAVQSVREDSIFKYRDTLTSRAEISDISEKLNRDVVAIIGLGGTGSYILDFLAKSPVQEIRGFDHDKYHVHNAFRSPGRLTDDELNRSKAEVFQSRYDNFRRNLKFEDTYVDASSAEKLDGVTFAFVCVDKGLARSAIIDLLIERNIPFIDVGMGLSRKESSLKGLLRVTYFSTEDAIETRSKKLVPESEDPANEYKANIQISELNAMNASLAVLRYKQIRGFYAAGEDIQNLLFTTCSMSMMRTTSDSED